MGARKEQYATNQLYHVFNQGIDRKNIFMDRVDRDRFFTGIREFNTIEPIGSIFEKQFINKRYKNKHSNRKQEELVRITAFCVNPNHFHFILEQAVDRGVEKFMQRLGTGYSKFFNNKYKRRGVLFQGRYKAKHIDSNEYLLHLSAYVNLNNLVHKLGSRASKSSWAEYIGDSTENICKKDIILSQFASKKEYKQFAESSLDDILARKKLYAELQDALLENHQDLEARLPS